MIRNNGAQGRIFSLASVTLAMLVCAAPGTAHAGTWRAQAPDASSAVTLRATPMRNHFETSGLRVPAESFPIRLVHLGALPAGMTRAQVDAAAHNASRAWSQIPCSFARIDYAGARESLAELGPGELPFQFVEPGGEGCLPGGAIGWTALSCGPGYPTNSVFLNRRDYHWSAKAQPYFPADEDDAPEILAVELRSVLTHELGHVLGLLHSEDSLAAMAPTYREDGGQRSLAVDDKLGVCALYPAVNPSDECASGRDCQAEQSCERVQLQALDGSESDRRIALCRELRGEIGDACAPDRRICVEKCVFAAKANDFGYCTVGCEAGGCPGEYTCSQGLIRPGEAHCRRLRAPEAAGCSAASGGHSISAPSPLVIWLAALAGVVRFTRRFRRPSKT